MPRRKPGTLLPLEIAILDVALACRRTGQDSFHGFALAEQLRAEQGGRSLTAHGTLYKALGRLEDLGFLTSHWEDPDAVEGRPRRRLYELTNAGVQAAELADAEVAEAPVRRVKPRLA